MKFKGVGYVLSIACRDGGAVLDGGSFYGIALAACPLFRMRVRDTSGETYHVSSACDWGAVEATDYEIVFSSHVHLGGIVVHLGLEREAGGIRFTLRVENTSESLSVMEISYPTPHMHAPHYSLFAPIGAGKLREGAEGKKIREAWGYPQHASMQFFAAYTEAGGIYIGIEDPTASAKRFVMVADGADFYVDAEYYAPGAGMAGNSFSIAGASRWHPLDGDWYDAAMLYRAFVTKHATWLPEGGIGRPDTPTRFHEIPFWISDYIPNTPAQRDNRPMNLSAGSDLYEPDYWYRAPIALRERLGMPLAYHVYNWHEIPFNIAYPHFLPAKAEFVSHAAELQRADVSVVPYINACAWEMHDEDAGFLLDNFESCGACGAAVREDGDFVVEEYPQTTERGHKSRLAIMCGGWEGWHDRMVALASKMQKTLPIDGIYFDEIANMPAHPCYSRTHGHLPGGGSYWADGYNDMMRRIRDNKPERHFHFTECNGEPYMKYMDGFLTWMWVDADEVPAFPAVYNGYIQLIGRCTIGNKKEDFDFFKYATARSLVSGQVPGWCKADIVYSEKHMSYLEKLVRCRYEHAAFLSNAAMLRPPHITTSQGKYTTAAGLWFSDTICSEWVVGGSFRTAEEVRMILVNFGSEDAIVTATVSAQEYGIDRGCLAKGCRLSDDDMLVYQCILPKEDVTVVRIPLTGNAL